MSMADYKTKQDGTDRPALAPIGDACDTYFVTSIAAPTASGWSIAGWDLHLLESAAVSRRTSKADFAVTRNTSDMR